MRTISTGALIALLAALSSTSPAAAQTLGTFRWQLQPYCNVISVTVVQEGGQYLIDGTDLQCGASRVAAVRGLAFPNPDGSVGFGLTIVTSPGGTPVHVDANIAVATLGGTWRDSAGNSGSFVFTPGAPVAGVPRPVPAAGIAPGTITNLEIANNTIGAGQVNTAQVQTRVSGACAAGQTIAAINADGSVVCRGATVVLSYSGSTTDTSAASIPHLFRTIGSFTKLSASSNVTTTWLSHVRTTGATTFCQFQVRIDGAQTQISSGFDGIVLYSDGSSATAPVSQTDYWTGLAAGTHTVSIWLRGNAASCNDNGGNFQRAVIVTEQ